uniref:Putative secreted peptide n=1 Tax=Anopheles braziliensis TaxID=58242 RepID=A0A2M3ZRS9_9DIPT
MLCLMVTVLMLVMMLMLMLRLMMVLLLLLLEELGCLQKRIHTGQHVGRRRAASPFVRHFVRRALHHLLLHLFQWLWCAGYTSHYVCVCPTVCDARREERTMGSSR